jgi:hypothetical protein
VANDDPGWPRLQGCPTCSAALVEHQYLDLGSAHAGSTDEADLLDLVDDEAWHQLPSVALAPDSNSLVFRALLCPSGTGAVVELWLHPSVLGDDEVRGPAFCLSAEGMNHLRSSVGGQWRPYTETWSARTQS